MIDKPFEPQTWEIEIGKAEFRRNLSEWETLGYKEGWLIFNSVLTKYKGVFYEDQLITIQSLKYRLFPNEKALEVAKRIADKLHGLLITALYSKTHPKVKNKQWGRQMYAMILFRKTIAMLNHNEYSHGLSIFNSIDGSLKFGMRSFLTIRDTDKKDSPSIYVFLPIRRDTSNLSSYVGKHMKSLETSTAKLTKIGETLLNSDEQLAKILEILHKTTMNKNHYKVLQDNLPEKLFDDVDGSDGRTLLQMYEYLCHKIWFNTSAELATKIVQFDILHTNLFDSAFIARMEEIE